MPWRTSMGFGRVCLGFANAGLAPQKQPSTRGKSPASRAATRRRRIGIISVMISLMVKSAAPAQTFGSILRWRNAAHACAGVGGWGR